jgi:hypothetical protein
MNDYLIGPIKYKGRYGFLAPSGEFAIDPIFEHLGQWNEGLVCFRKEGRYGFLNLLGEVTLPPVFESSRLMGPRFSSGLASVTRNAQAGYINISGDFAIPPRFSNGRDFLDEFAVADMAVHEGGSVLIDKGGEILTRLPVHEVPDVPGWPNSWDLFACFCRVKERILIGFYNWMGEVMFEPRYPFMTNFFEGVAGFCEDENDWQYKHGLVGISGNVLRSPAFYQMSDFRDGLARAGRNPKEVGFIDKTGHWMIEPKFEQARPFSEGLACVTVKSKKGFINKNGEFVIEPRFDHESTFLKEHAQVEAEGRVMVINTDGGIIWEAPATAANVDG